MPSEIARTKLANFVKTTSNKAEIEKQLGSLLNDFSTINPPSPLDIQNKYSLLYRMFLECYPDMSNKIEQASLISILSDLKELEEVKIDIPNLSTGAYDEKICTWITECVNNGLLVNITASNNVTSGLILSYQGQYANYTLDKIIKDRVYA